MKKELIKTDHTFIVKHIHKDNANVKVDVYACISNGAAALKKSMIISDLDSSGQFSGFSEMSDEELGENGLSFEETNEKFTIEDSINDVKDVVEIEQVGVLQLV